jgi:hypothetical protein
MYGGPVSDMRLLALHGLVVKSAASPEAVATLLGQPVDEVQQALESAVTDGHAVGAKGRYMVTPSGRAWLDEHYPKAFAAHRDDPAFTAAADRFERINRDLLALLTDWQSMPAGGERVPNTHTDPEYDRAVIDRLGDLHDRAAKILKRLSSVEPRLEEYSRRLEAAYDKALAGEPDYVSGVRVDSYHVVWHELHEDLLRMLGRTREE